MEFIDYIDRYRTHPFKFFGGYKCFCGAADTPVLDFSSGPPLGLKARVGSLIQGWEVWPHAHLNEKLKSINIC